MIASSIGIFELSGLKRSLILVGPGLPFRGTKWGMETRLKTKFLAGNTEAVQHVLGPAESPTDFEGMWRTTQLIKTPSTYVDENGASQKVTRASTMVQILESFARAGSLLRVVWATDDGRSILREGRIGPISFPYDRFDDVKWTCTFMWIGRGSSQQKVVFFKGEQTDASVIGALQTLSNVLGTLAGASVRSSDPTNDLSASNDSLGAFESLSSSFNQSKLVTGIGASVSVGFGFGATAGYGTTVNTGFGAGVSASAKFGSNSGFLSGVNASVSVAVASVSASVNATQAYQANPAELAREASQVGRSSTVQMNATLDLVGQTPPELLSAVPTPSAIARATAYVSATKKSLAAAAKAAHTVAIIARLRRSAADPSVGRIDRASANDAVKVHTAKKTETFAAISLRYYGTADRAREIAKANGIPAFRVSPDPGTRLIIPVLTSSNTNAKST